MLAQLSALRDVPEPVEVDVGAADDGDVPQGIILVVAFREFLEPRHGQGASGFGDQARVVEHILDGGANLVDRNDDNLVDAGPGDVKRLPSDLRHGHAVCEHVQRVERQANTPSRLERRRQARGTFGFHPDDLRFGAQVLDVRRDSGDETAPAYRDEDGVEFRLLVQDFHAHRALASDDIHVVVRMHWHVAPAFGQTGGMLRRVSVCVAVQHHVAAEVAHRIDLDARRVATHDNMRLDAEPVRRQRHALGMVARRGGDHVPRALRIGKLGDLVVRAAHLEGKGGLHVLSLQPDLVAKPRRNVVGALQWRLHREVIDPGR